MRTATSCDLSRALVCLVVDLVRELHELVHCDGAEQRLRGVLPNSSRGRKRRRPGSSGRDGKYPAHSFHAQVESRPRELSEGLAKYRGG